MATSAQIAAAIAEAQALNIQASDMVLLIDRAIAAAFAGAGTGELPAVTYSIGGRSRTISMTEALAIKKHYMALADGSGGLSFQSIEFGV